MGRPSLRVGFIGCGRVTVDHHLPALSSLDGIEATAVADTDSGRLDLVRERHGIEGLHENHRELLEDDVDLVCVAVPPAAHTGIARDVLDAGRHLLVEKPLALTLEDADELVGHAAAAGVVASVGFNLRSHRFVQRAVALLRKGELGRVEAVRTVLTACLGRRDRVPEWRRRRETGGGALFELASHHFDLWRHLSGEEVAEVAAFSRSGPLDDTAVTVQGRLASGALASSTFCQGTSDCHEVEVFGREGRLRASIYQVDGFDTFSLSDLPGGIPSRLARFGRRLGRLPEIAASLRQGGVYLESFRREWAALRDAVGGGSPSGTSEAGAPAPPCTLLDGRQATAATVAAARAIEEGTVVRVEPPPAARGS